MGWAGLAGAGAHAGKFQLIWLGWEGRQGLGATLGNFNYFGRRAGRGARAGALQAAKHCGQPLMWRPSLDRLATGWAGGGVKAPPNIWKLNFQGPDAYRPADSYTLGYSKKGGKQVQAVDYDSEHLRTPLLHFLSMCTPGLRGVRQRPLELARGCSWR